MRLLAGLAPILLLATPVPSLGDAASSGYKGIAWGSPCMAARSALVGQGVKFRDATAEPLGSAVRLDPAYAFSPACSDRSGHFGSFAKVDGDGPDFLDVSVLCREEKFVGIWVSGLSAYSGAIDKVRGKPIQTKSGRDSLNNKSRFERLTDRGDSVRFFHESWNKVDEHYVAYLVMAKNEFAGLLATQKACAEMKKSEKNGRGAKQESNSAHPLVE